MPWIKQSERKEVENYTQLKLLTTGQVTYLFYKVFLQLWHKNQKYKTIHFIGLLRERPELEVNTWKLTSDILFKGLTKSDITQCRYDAHHQMERKYFDLYEDEKLKANGEVEV